MSLFCIYGVSLPNFKADKLREKFNNCSKRLKTAAKNQQKNKVIDIIWALYCARRIHILIFKFVLLFVFKVSSNFKESKNVLVVNCQNSVVYYQSTTLVKWR